jgi:hypothetical protein
VVHPTGPTDPRPRQPSHNRPNGSAARSPGRATLLTICSQTVRIPLDVTAHVRGKPRVDLMPTLRGPATVVLAGRATTVPFTTDLSGRKRTPTDIPMGAVTYAVRRQARWRPRPIWLCKQGVSSSRLRPVLLCGDRVEFSSGGAMPDRVVKGIGRTVARSVCRSSGHNLGSQRTSLSGALLAATTRRPLSGMGQWPTSWNQSKSRVSMLPPSSHGLRPLHRRTAATCCMRWVHCDGAAGLVRLAGTDPTMSED